MKEEVVLQGDRQNGWRTRGSPKLRTTEHSMTFLSSCGTGPPPPPPTMLKRSRRLGSNLIILFYYGRGHPRMLQGRSRVCRTGDRPTFDIDGTSFCRRNRKLPYCPVTVPLSQTLETLRRSTHRTE